MVIQAFFPECRHVPSISGERFSVLRQMKWSLAERYLKHPSACNINIMSGLRCNLKDEGSFCKIPV